MSRYARQIILPEVGAAGQARLAAARVLVVGAGGLGAPVLQYLAGAGIGGLTVMDPDPVEESNLHRQVLFTQSDIAKPKAEVACRHLQQRNPDIRIVAQNSALTAENARDAVAAADLVLDCADSFAVSYILSDNCFAQNRPLISASVLGQQGYVGGFCAGAPSLRALFPELPEQGATCATAGVLGPVVGMIGATQAQMALQVLLQQQPSPLGQLMQVNMADFRCSGFRFDTAPEPADPLCFTSPALLQADSQVIDLRSSAEAPTPVASGARRVSPADLDEMDLPKDQPVVLCCQTGLRAWRAARRLQTRGFRQIQLIATSACP